MFFFNFTEMQDLGRNLQKHSDSQFVTVSRNEKEHHLLSKFLGSRDQLQFSIQWPCVAEVKSLVVSVVSGSLPAKYIFYVCIYFFACIFSTVMITFVSVIFNYHLAK